MNDKQKRFCDEYLIDLNATQAAIRAGYSEKTAYSIGWENLRKPEILEYLSKRQKDRQKRTEVDQSKVVEEYSKIAFVDLENDPLVNYGLVKADHKLKALDKLGQHIGMFTDKVELTGNVDVAMVDKRHIMEKRLEELRNEHES